MSLTQSLSEFRFNLETLDLLTTMNHTEDQAVEMMNELGLQSSLVKFMLSQRNVLNMVLLRLKLYEKQNVDEKTVRSGLSSLNNKNVDSLLDLLYAFNKKVSPVKTETKKSVVKETPVEEVKPVETEEEQEVEEENVEEEEESHFESFFNQCVRHTDDVSDSVKLSEMYNVFTKWWHEHYEDEVPSKDELKDFFSEKLGVKVKSTITHVHLI